MTRFLPDGTNMIDEFTGVRGLSGRTVARAEFTQGTDSDTIRLYMADGAVYELKSWGERQADSGLIMVELDPAKFPRPS